MDLFARENELIETRRKLIEDNRKIVLKAEGENRSFNAEEKAEYEKRSTEIQEMTGRIGNIRKDVQTEAMLKDVAEARHERVSDGSDAETRNASKKDAVAEFRNSLCAAGLYNSGKTMFSGEFKSMKEAEFRGFSAGTANKGGEFIPEAWINEYIVKLNNLAPIKRISRNFNVPLGTSLPLPVFSGSYDNQSIIGENTAATDDNSSPTTEVVMSPRQRLHYPIPVSKTLLAASSLNVEELILEQASAAISDKMEYYACLGSGSSGPLGIFYASASGISTSQDVDGTVDVANAKEVKWSLPAKYHSRASWVMNPAIVGELDKETDSNGRFLWEPSTVASQPDRLCGLPVLMSDQAPDDMSTGNYVAVLGSFDYYVFAIGQDIQVEVENVYGSNQVKYHNTVFFDCKPVLADAFRRWKSLGS